MQRQQATGTAGRVSPAPGRRSAGAGAPASPSGAGMGRCSKKTSRPPTSRSTCWARRRIFLRLAGQAEGQGRDEDALAYWRDENRFPQPPDARAARGATSASPSCGSSCSTPGASTTSRRSRAPRNAELAARGGQGPQGNPLPPAAQQRVGAPAGRRNRREPPPDAGGARRAVALDRGAEPGRTRWTPSCGRAGIAPDLEPLQAPWEAMVRDVLAPGDADHPDGPMRMTRGRRGRHTEHLGHMLAEMQIVARIAPGGQMVSKRER